MSLNKDTHKLKACWCCSLTFIRVAAPKGAICTVFVSSNIHRRILFSNSSFKRFNFTLLEQLNTNLHGISIPPQSCLQWRLWPVTSTRIFPPRARKYQDIREYSRGKWPTVSFCVVLPRPRLLSTFESLAAKHSFVSFQTRTNLSEFQLHGVFWSDNLEKVVSTDKIWWIQTEIKVW